MLARIFTRLFYAAVFFALGVWAAPSIGGFGGLIDSSIAAGSQGFDRLWSWAESTISSAPAPTTPVAVPAAAPTPLSKPASTVAVPSVPPAPPPPSLDVARAAAARGDVSAAVQAYEALIAERPSDVALRGELGNVYWSTGRLQDAARAYHAAATALLATGRADDARRLEPIVRKGDVALADDLVRRLAEASRVK